MTQPCFLLEGRVVRLGTNIGISDLTVVLSDREIGDPAVLCRGTTDDDGVFQIPLSREDASVLMGPGQGVLWDAAATVYLAAYKGNIEAYRGSQRVEMGDLAGGRLPEQLEVDLSGSDAIRLSVHGRVIREDGSPVTSTSLQVDRVEGGLLTKLAIGSTDARGNFDIEYTGAVESTTHRSNLALSITVQDMSGASIATTPIVFDPSSRHRVDVLVGEIDQYKGQPEFTIVAEAVNERMNGAVPTAEDVELLAKRSGIDPQLVGMYVQSLRLASNGIPPEASYAIMRAGLPASFPQQLALSTLALRDALESARANNIVGPTLVDGTTFDIEDLVALYVQRKVDAVISGDRGNTGVLIDSSGLARTVTDDFLSRWVVHEGSREVFWSDVRDGGDFDAGDLDTLEFTMAAAEIVNGYAPILEAIQSSRSGGSVNVVSDLAGWDATQWNVLVADHGAPDSLPGDPPEREAQYAKTLRRIVQATYPTQTIARRFAASPLSEAAGVSEFLDANPAFQIDRTVVATYLAEHAGAIPGGLNAEEVEANLKRVQRIHSLAPQAERYDVTRALLEAGVDSAAAIVHQGRSAFVRAHDTDLDGVHEDLDGRAVAEHVYGSAVRKHAFSLALMTRYAASMNTVSIDAIPAYVLTGNEGPAAAELAEIFGSLDYCACEHCRSMFGPAAYLVDLLSSLESANVLGALTARRSDIQTLELSCHNTDTPLPYIDLVNEVLERASLWPHGSPQARQTTWRAEELRLNPEPTNFERSIDGQIVRPYDGPAQASFPWSLPIDAHGEAMHAYTEQLGLSRAEAMALFDRAAAATVIEPRLIAAERLGMAPLAFDLAAANAGTPSSEAWGFVADPADWAEQLSNDVRRVLETASVTHGELLELIGTNFVRNSLAGTTALTVGYVNDEPSCDVDDLVLHGFDAFAAGRMHRFVRAARGLDIDWRSLDIAITALSGLDETSMAQMADMLDVRDRLRIPIDEACVLWANVDTREYGDVPSVYTRLFASNTVLAETEGTLELGGALDANVHFSHLRSALGVNDSDLRILLSAVSDEPTPTVDLTLVSRLYAHARLARGLRLQVADLLRFLRLVAIDPFSAPAETIAFLDVVDEVRNSGVSLEAIDFLCRHAFESERGLQLSDEVIARRLEQVVVAKADVDAQLVVDGVSSEILRAHAESVLETPADVAALIRVLSSEPISDAGTADGDWLREQLIPIVEDPDIFLGGLSGPDGGGAFDARLLEVAEVFQEFRRLDGYRERVAAAVATWASVDADVATQLATDLVHVEGVSIVDTLVASSSDDQITALRKFHKAALLVGGLGVESRDLAWIFSTSGGQAEAMNLDELPLTLTDDSVARANFAQWRAVRLWGELLAGLTTASERLHAIAEDFPAPGAEGEGSVPALAEVTGWHALDIQWARTDAWLSFGPAGIRDPQIFAALRDMADAVRRTGVRAEQLAMWARTAPSRESADDARQALRARYTESTWPDVILPISDRLRERRRDALLDFIIGRGDFASADEVYAHYLLDPQMSACTLTSRLKLATSSVQLFAQRTLMGLEPDASLDTEFARDWTWRKNYRVWEAARKVFFYPENWITPELRVDKTPFFAEFETHLRGGELRPQDIRQGLSDYLQKVREVSNLVVLDVHEAAGDVHVVGRSRNSPYRYYYRRRVQGTHWTPWERIEAGVSGEHLLLHVMAGRLFLFWAEFAQQTEKFGSEGIGDDFDDPGREVLKVSLSWIERHGTEWGEPRRTPVSEERFPYTDVKHVRMWGATADGWSQVYLMGSNPESPSPSTVRFAYDAHSDEFAESPTSWTYPISRFSFNHRTPNATSERGAQSSPFKLQGTEDGAPVWLLVFAQSDYRVTRTHQGVPPRTGSVVDYRSCVFDANGYTTFVEREAHWMPAVAVWNGAMSSVDNPPSAQEFVGADSSEVGFERVDPYFVVQSADAGGYGAGAATASSVPLLALPDIAYAPSYGGELRWLFSSFFHPFALPMLEALNNEGVDGLYRSKKGSLRQQLAQVQRFVSTVDAEDGDLNQVGPQVLQPYPVDDFDFSHGGAYSTYNWEIFFHIPMLVASRLRAEGRFAQADKWYRYVFDPLAGTEEDGVGRFWNVKPLYEEAVEHTPDLVQALFSNESPDPADPKIRDFQRGLLRWQADPFNPHAVALTRPGTYRWVAVRGYLDNIIDWADSLFRRDTIESINEATQLYVLAANLLGAKPQQLEEMDVQVETYGSIDFPGLFGGLAEIEGFVPTPPEQSIGGLNIPIGGGYPVPIGTTFGTLPDPQEPPEIEGILPSDPPGPLWWTFCLPANPQLLEYWDRVADRMFKIRNCMNIEGVTRTLALFEPPIDPALLVRARAAGLDLGDVINGLGAPLPKHRYRVLVARSLDLVGDVRALGGALLTAIEKRDAETLSRLRTVHETATLTRIREVRQHQVDEAQAQLESLRNSRKLVEQRETYYASLRAAGLNDEESLQITEIGFAQGARSNKRALELMSMGVAMLPNASTGTSGFNLSFGSTQLAAYYTFLANATNGDAAEFDTNAQLASINAGYARRGQDWAQQERLAQLEQEQLDKQIIAAEIRVELAKREQSNHEGQVEQAQELQRFFAQKYTGEELYDWMMSEISNLYFQAYKLAFDMAKKAERAMQFELETDDTFVEFGYWDGLKKGLLSGERLQLDIKRMESAYLEQNTRELELTKRVSLRHVAPEALLDLRANGTCSFDLPEVLFDLDHPGHYLRRIRAVRVTIPAVAGPQTSIGATLTLLRDELRIQPADGDENVRVTYGGSSQIATSHAQDDGGLFELNFRDERYLPFEGAGVASRWQLRLPEVVRQFDYNSIADVEIRIDYSARDGGGVFRGDVEGRLNAGLQDALASASDEGMALVLHATKDFSVDWERFLRPAEGQTSTELSVPITRAHLPYVLRNMDVAVTSVDLLVQGGGHATPISDVGTLAPPAPVDTAVLSAGSELPARFGAEFVVEGDGEPIPVDDSPWVVDLDGALDVTDADQVDDLWVVVRLSISLPNQGE